MSAFTQTEQPSEHPLFMEVFTDKAEDVRLLKEYYHQLKNSSQAQKHIIYGNEKENGQPSKNMKNPVRFL